jgi:hypothetical protein
MLMYVANIKIKALLLLSMTVCTIFLLILASIGLDHGSLDQYIVRCQAYNRGPRPAGSVFL